MTAIRAFNPSCQPFSGDEPIVLSLIGNEPELPSLLDVDFGQCRRDNIGGGIIYLRGCFYLGIEGDDEAVRVPFPVTLFKTMDIEPGPVRGTP